MLFFKILFSLSLILAFNFNVLGQEEDLELRPKEVYIEFNSSEEGFHLWVENKPGIGSILITDHTSDPKKKQAAYALRASTYNSINGDEERVLSGKKLPSNLYSLIDSSPETNPYFPRGAFHIFIPYRVVYGYPWSRNGTKLIGKGSWLNVRTFPLAYGDYANGFKDNPFILSLDELPEIYSPGDIEDITKPIEEDEAEIYSPPQISSALEDVETTIDKLALNTIDIALVLDTTISMRDNVSFLKTQLIPLVEQKVKNFDRFRIGVVLYKDYNQEYLTKPFNFMEDLSEVQKILDAIEVKGGGDREEAVYEAMHSALTELTWEANKKLIIQIGDAPPHKNPKGLHTRESVYLLANQENVQIQAIMLEDNAKTSKITSKGSIKELKSEDPRTGEEELIDSPTDTREEDIAEFDL